MCGGRLRAHTERMRRGWIAAVLAALMVGGLFAVTAALASGPAGETTAATPARDADDPRQGDGEGDGEGAGHGRPPWAHSNKAAAIGHGRNAAWKEAWRQLTPAQRERKMKRLADAHAAGMRAWKSCVDAAADDETKRAACERPLPPGLAKKQLD